MLETCPKCEREQGPDSRYGFPELVGACRLQLGTLIVDEHQLPAEKPLAPSEQIRLLIESLAFQATRVAKSSGPEPVPDLRVAIRRLDQAITTYKTYLPRKSVKRIRKRLKTVLSAAGAVRDCDIAAKILSKISQPGAVAFNRHVQHLRRDHERSLLLELKTLSLRTRISKWCDSLSLNPSQSDLNVQTVQTIAMGRLPKLARRFFGAGEKAAGHGSAKELHSLRSTGISDRRWLRQEASRCLVAIGTAQDSPVSRSLGRKVFRHDEYPMDSFLTKDRGGLGRCQQARCCRRGMAYGVAKGRLGTCVEGIKEVQELP